VAPLQAAHLHGCVRRIRILTHESCLRIVRNTRVGAEVFGLARSARDDHFERMVRKPTPEEEENLAAYRSRLELHLDSLERFPRSSYVQVVVLAISLIIFYVGFIGLIFLPVPLYLIVPIIVMPAWTLLRHEMKWRTEWKNTKSQLSHIERKRDR